MSIKDMMFLWYLKNISIPRLEVLDSPGFIALRFSEKGRSIFLRELALPESVFVDLERAIKKKYGDTGRQILYSAGKKFTYNYANMSAFPKKGEIPLKNLLAFADLTIKFISSMFARSARHEIDINKEQITFYLKDWVICNKDGMGYFLTEGAAAGLWSWVMNNKDIEAAHQFCQGNGYEECKLVCAPKTTLKQTKIEFFCENDLSLLPKDFSYEQINSIRNTEFARSSLKELIDANVFNYSHGILSYKNERFFICEASSIYILENELKKLKGADRLLFQVSFDFGKRIAEEKKAEGLKFVTDFASALGLGDVMALSKKGKWYVTVNYFPWIKFSHEINFSLLTGLLSGLLSGLLDKKIVLTKTVADTSKGFLSLVIYQ